MKKAEIRIIQDYVKFSQDNIDDIYLHINHDNIFVQYAMIVGPVNTPYFGGFYIFKITYPTDYPQSPPHVVMITTNMKIRFNPNISECGKLYLSILDESSWKPYMNIKLVLLSIQSLMTDTPLKNEPYYENMKEDNYKMVYYNNYITFYNYKFAIIEILNMIISFKNSNNYIKYFTETIIIEFKKNYQKLLNDLNSYIITIGINEIKKNTIYFIHENHTIDFMSLINDFNNAYHQICILYE